jgi:hypothetical protein
MHEHTMMEKAMLRMSDESFDIYITHRLVG